MNWRCLWKVGALLGEGPLWWHEADALLFVDIKRPEILGYYLDGRTVRVPVPAEIGCIAHRRSGGLVAALRNGIAHVDLGRPHVEMVLPLEDDLPGNRFNDGKVDPAGRLWVASMDDKAQLASGAIWRVVGTLSAKRMAGGHIVGNGFGWNPDGTLMYFTDSEARTIYAYAFAPKSGELGERRVFARVAPQDGYPDGLTVDAEGFVWSAHWDGARVTRYCPNGSVDRVIALPVPRPTSLAFGGKDLDRLFVTSASIGLDGDALEHAPLSGGLFEIDAGGVCGKPETPFAG